MGLPRLKPAIVTVTSFATELATPSVTDERTLRTYGHLTAFKSVRQENSLNRCSFLRSAMDI